MEKKSSTGIAYQIEHNKNNSKIIIFLHALALNKSAMNDILSFFLNHNYNIINIELRGHGNSIKSNCYKETYIQESINDILQILNQEKITNKITILGHSLGAVISSCLVAKYPKKFNKLIICAPLFRNPLRDQIINASFIKFFILFITYINCYLSKIIYKDKYFKLNKFSQKTAQLFFMGLSKCCPRDIFNISSIIYSNSFDISNELKKIKNDTLIVGGENDFLVNSKILNKIKNLIINSVLKIYPGNHLIIYKTKKIWSNILNFIEGN